MENLLEELYKTDLHVEKFHFRKVYLSEDTSYQINGISQSGKTKLVKNYLLSLKKGSYMYIDCSDLRIDTAELNISLSGFCKKYGIDTLALDNYSQEIDLVSVKQLIVCSQTYNPIDFLERVVLYPLDYEEFLAYEHKYDSSALNHFFQLGGLPFMHKINADERVYYIQKALKSTLGDIELDILALCAKMMTQRISPYSLYERLKQSRKISKDKLYASFETLCEKNYIHKLQKIDHPKAIAKIYLCDISLKSALTIEKNFAKLFENMIYLELLKSGAQVFYDEGADFYLPRKDEIVLAAPFTDERVLFKKIESLEAFIFRYQIKKVTAVTMSKESTLSHPFSKVEIVPFDIWALGD